MKILIDISNLHYLALKRGVGFYAFNLLKTLKKLDDGNKYFLKTKREEHFTCDLVHIPCFDPFFINLPINSKQKTVVTIHDLIPVKFIEHYSVGIKGKLKWQVQKKLVKKSMGIITDSANSKKDIINIINYPANKIYPILLAAGDEFKKLSRCNSRRSSDGVSILSTHRESSDLFGEEISKKYSLPECFLLYVGDLNWNKNVKGLIKAFHKLKVKSEKFKIKVKSLKLVLIGTAFKNNKLEELRQLDVLISQLKLENEVVKLGFVPVTDLVKIYNLATLYIQPSFYEGFGLPVLEAMSCGCPVLCSDKGSLPEVGGQAVEYFDPYKENEFCLKLTDLILDKKHLNNLSQIGIKQSKKFSWLKTALETKKVYNSVRKDHPLKG